MMIFFSLMMMSLDWNTTSPMVPSITIMGFLWAITKKNAKVLFVLLTIEMLTIYTIFVFVSPLNSQNTNFITLFTLFTIAVGSACIGLGVYLKHFRAIASSSIDSF